MTYPVTPNPNIKTDPTAQADLQKQLQTERAALQQLFSSLIPQIIKLLLNGFTNNTGLNTVEQTIVNDINSLVSWFHSTFNASTDFNTLLHNLFGTPTLGTVLQGSALPNITLNLSTDMQAISDAIASNLSGTSIIGSSVSEAGQALYAIFNTIVQTAQGLHSIQQTSLGQTNSGISYTENFGNDPAGLLPSDWTVHYSGTGGSTIVVDSSGHAHWNTVANANKSAIVINNTYPTQTVYQLVGATVSSGPATHGAANYQIARSNATGTEYVYARYYSTGFLNFEAEIGCVIGGTRTVWNTGISMPVNTNNFLQAGTPSSVNQYQIKSGNDIIYSYTDTGTFTSKVDTSHLYWGWGGDVTVSGGVAYAPGDGVLVSVADNAPPATVGSGMAAYRTSTSNVTLYGAITHLIPGGFFNGGVSRQTSDITWDSSTNTATVSIAGWYQVNCKILFNSPYGAEAQIVLYRNGTVIQRDAQFYNSQAIAGHFTVYLSAGDSVQPGTYASGIAPTATGEASGTSSQFDMALLCRSLN